MIPLQQFARAYVPIGFLVAISCIWFIMDILFKDETNIKDILGAGILSFLFGYNLMFILWGTSLL